MTITHTDFVVPTGREEQWRFTPLARLRGLEAEAEFTGQVGIDWDPTDCRVERCSSDGIRYEPVDRVSSRAWADVSEVVQVTIPRERAGGPSVNVRIKGLGGVASGHIRIVAEPFSSATVVLTHTGAGAFAGNVDIVMGDGASLTVVSQQLWDADALHLGHHHVTVGRDARYRSAVVTLGGDVVRLVSTVDYAGPGGDAEMLGVFLVGSGQHVEHRLLATHTEPHCRSNVAYKGALDGDGAHSVWIGDVIVRPNAIGTDTYELNRNLLLSEGARADSVPNLELETGEITGAGHASATGRFDDDQLFYLQSRGIPMDVARMLVVRGFFADVVQRVGDPDLEAAVLLSVDARLESLGLGHIDEGIDS